LLQGILGAPRARLQAAAVRKQLLPVPADKSFERRFVPIARECDQPVIWLRLQEVK
jgi:hypothetical protein